jgi:hypothetical protein
MIRWPTNWKEVDRSGRGWFEVLSQIAPEGNDGNLEDRSQDSRYLNPGPPDYAAVFYQLGRDISRYIDAAKIGIREGA